MVVILAITKSSLAWPVDPEATSMMETPTFAVKSLATVLMMNPLTQRSNLLLSTTDHQMGPLLLTEKSVHLVAATCPRLERLGNLQR